ncbi:MAG: sn-glycerol-1-phosphate dehydrogenase [Pseudomonadota bacterium]
MALLKDETIPSKRKNLLGQSWDCECGQRHSVGTRAVLIEDGALRKTGDVILSLGLSGLALIVADETTHDLAGRDVARSIEKAGLKSRPFIIPGKKPHADDATAELVAGAVDSGDALVVSVGSGTVTDLAKWAAFAHGLPQVAVATAPSMNGYASGIVALTRGGLKTTEAVRPAIAVIADTGLLSGAPIDMIRAGLGDVMSKPVCNADWKLASLIRGEHFCPRPFELTRDLEKLYIRDASLIGMRDPRAIAGLAEALIFSGVSMVIAGSSAPASGGEHLISHFLDMRALAEGREPDFHGAQVGVATVATAALYERLASLDERDIDQGAVASAWERSEVALSKCRSLFGSAGGAVASEYEKKRGTRKSFEEGVQRIKKEWSGIKRVVAPYLMPAEYIRAVLDRAGAKAHYSRLGIGRDEFRDAIMFAMCIRSRYTVLDVAFAIGELENWADDFTGR